MAVSVDMISQVSSYEVAEAGPFTPALFALYSPVAKARLDRMDPGLDSGTYDYCHALLICHQYASKAGGLDLKSESIGDYSYTKATEAGQTSYLTECMEIIATFQGGEVQNEGVAMDDREIMTLDQNELGFIESED